jgi:hypothetical protein
MKNLLRELFKKPLFIFFQYVDHRNDKRTRVFLPERIFVSEPEAKESAFDIEPTVIIQFAIDPRENNKLQRLTWIERKLTELAKQHMADNKRTEEEYKIFENSNEAIKKSIGRTIEYGNVEKQIIKLQLLCKNQGRIKLPSCSIEVVFNRVSDIFHILLLVAISLNDTDDIQDIHYKTYYPRVYNKSRTELNLSQELQKRRMILFNALVKIRKNYHMIQDTGLLYRLAMEIIRDHITNYTFIFPHGGGVRHDPSSPKMSHTAKVIMDIIDPIRDDYNLTDADLSEAFAKISSRLKQAQQRPPGFKLFFMELNFRDETTTELYNRLEAFISKFEKIKQANKEEACNAIVEARSKLPVELAPEIVEFFCDTESPSPGI